MTRKSSPGGAAPYSASLISLSVPSTPTRSTSTRTPRPPGTSSTEGSGTSARWIDPAFPGCTAIAFMSALSPSGRTRYSRGVEHAVQLEEMRLVEALREGDERAFEELIRMYQAALLRVAQIYVSSRSVAEEVVQETWLAVLGGIDRFEGRSSLKTWLFRILANRTRCPRRPSTRIASKTPSIHAGPAIGPRLRPTGRRSGSSLTRLCG